MSGPPIDVAVIGAGSAAGTLVAELDGHDLRVVVFEQHRVGGTCPFVACIPSKSLLHDAAVGTRWQPAVARRDDAVSQLDDRGHVEQLEHHGAELVRAHARIVDATTVEADGVRYTARHIVIATGSEATMPDIDGLTDIDEFVWTSDDAMTTSERPTRLAVVGGGVIGCELADLFAGFGTEVHLLDPVEHAFADLSPEVGDVVDAGLRAVGVRVCRGTSPIGFDRRGGNVRISLDNGSTLITDRVLVATGRRARTADIGLEAIRVDPDRPLPVGDSGRVDCPASLWAIGDVSGRAQHTHVANHQARVVADQLVGDGTRRFDDVTTPSCVFTRAPVMIVGPSRADLDGDDDIVWATAELSEVARWTTDDLADGFLAVAARRSTRCLVAAHGAGAKFDELVHALVVAIDGRVPVERLAMSMLPFPTVGEVLAPIYSRLLRGLDDT